MRRFLLIFWLLLGMAAVSPAQTYTQHLQGKQQGKASVTVTQSREIDELVNGANVSARSQEPVARPQAPQAQNNTPNKKQNTQDAVTQKHGTTQHNGDSAHSASREQTERHEQHTAQQHENRNSDTPDSDTPAVDTRKKVMRRSYKVNGYRVQVFAGGNSRNDKLKAQNAGNAVKQAFPSQPVYVHFYSPRWICRMGNYRTYEEASAILHQVQKMGYKQACIVSGKITVAY